jgi:hypothetical protein
MAFKKLVLTLSIGLSAAMLTACASQPQPTTAPAAKPATPAAGKPSSAATEADTATAMEKRFQDAARSYKVVQKDGKTLYCKREKQIGTTIPTMNCMTESQLRNQVETMEEYRQRARNAARCTHGAGCGAGS